MFSWFKKRGDGGRVGGQKTQQDLLPDLTNYQNTCNYFVGEVQIDLFKFRLLTANRNIYM